MRHRSLAIGCRSKAIERRSKAIAVVLQRSKERAALSGGSDMPRHLQAIGSTEQAVLHHQAIGHTQLAQQRATQARA